MEMDSERFNQIVAFVVAVLMGIVTFLRGGKKSAGTSDAPNADAELSRLRDERDRQIVLDIKALRADFEIVLKALKDSMGDSFEKIDLLIHNIDGRLHEVEKKIAVVEDRQLRQH
jgi:hypothetical protein